MRFFRGHASVPFALVTALLPACTPAPPPPAESSPAVSVEARGPNLLVADRGPSSTDDAADFARGCLTLRDVAASDVLRVDGRTLYYLDEGSGFWIVDVADPDQPQVAGHVPHVGSPLYLFVRSGIAWVIFVDWDHRWLPSPAVTVIRAVDVREAGHPVVLGEVARSGIIEDARLVGGMLYVLRDGAKHASVEALGVVDGALRPLDRERIDGHALELAASSAGLAAITMDADAAAVTWLDLPAERPGAIEVRNRVRLGGGIPTPRGEGARIADADDGQTVHVVTCDTPTCAPSEGSRLHVVDFSANPPKQSPGVRIAERGGLPLVRFVDGRAYAATVIEDGAARSSAEELKSDLRIIELYPAPKIAGRVRLRGVLTTLVPREGSLLTLGRASSTEGLGKIVLHEIDVRQPSAPRLRGSARFGADWTWATGGDDEAGISFDASSRLAAVPFTAFREKDQRYGVGAQLIELGAKVPKAGPALPAGQYVERAVFLEGRLLMIGAAGIETIDVRKGASSAAEGLRL